MLYIVKRIFGIIVLLLAVSLLIYCEDPEQIARERSTRISQRDKESVRTTESDDYYGIYSFSDYERESCDKLPEDDRDYESCQKICDTVYGKKHRECEDLPVDLIFRLEKLYNSMLRIRAGENQLNDRINTFDFGVMIDVDIEPAVLLIELWSDRELKEFLLWVAITPSVARALKHHDRENVILEEAFKKLGDSLSGRSRVEYGLGQSIRSHGETFWRVAEEENNETAFVVVHRLLMKICSTKNCKLKLYCLREEFENAFTRQRQCHYARDRRSFRSTNCYTHGPNVWAYWENLNREGEFGDNHFSREAKLNEELCDTVCAREVCTINK